MHEDGLVSNYSDYLDLPLAVIEDWRMQAEGKVQQQERQNREARRGNRR